MNSEAISIDISVIFCLNDLLEHSLMMELYIDHVVARILHNTSYINLLFFPVYIKMIILHVFEKQRKTSL